MSDRVNRDLVAFNRFQPRTIKWEGIKIAVDAVYDNEGKHTYYIGTLDNGFEFSMKKDEDTKRFIPTNPNEVRTALEVGDQQLVEA